MTVAPDFVAALKPWQTADQDAFATVIGGMFAEVEQYAADPDDPDTSAIYVNRRNECPTPSFGHFTDGGMPGQWAPGAGSTAVVSGIWSHAGEQSMLLSAAGVASSGVAVATIDVSDLALSSGQLVSLAAWFNITTVDTYPWVEVEFFNGSGVSIGTAPAPASWELEFNES